MIYERPLRYIQVSIDRNEDGFSVQCWWSTDQLPMWERASYPHNYLYLGDLCDWRIFSSGELTPVLQHTIGNEAEKNCATARAINAKRKLSNR